MKPEPPNTCVAVRVAVDGRLGGVQLGHGRRLAEGPAVVLEPRRLVGEVAGVLDGDGEVGEGEGDGLEASDRAAEGVALLGVGDGVVEAGLGQPDGQGGDGDAPVVEDRQEVAEAGAAVAEQVRSGTRQPSRLMPWVSEACQPSLR